MIHSHHSHDIREILYGNQIVPLHSARYILKLVQEFLLRVDIFFKAIHLKGNDSSRQLAPAYRVM
ncbi:hypothetical protein ABER23_13150 [Paenibacillus lautus]|uniref:hypothetical protein n=1 Tax=Paenibacillus lautus TaxID=1401 RepID=UPI003D2CC200